MTGLNFAILCGLNFMLFSCKGQVTVSPGQDIHYVKPENDVTIVWSIDGARVSDFVQRLWRFIPTNELLAFITLDSNVIKRNSSLKSGITITKPSTMALSNVDTKYNGTYEFVVELDRGRYSSYADVFVLVAPRITVNCSSFTTVKQDDYFACECKGTGGNPPADVTWYKDNTQITGKEKAILSFANVDRDNGGTYRCKAESHEDAKNETSIVLIVNYPPENVKLELDRSGQSATITCTAESRPEPSFKIFLNQTILVKSDKTYIISKVNSTHVGNYTCVAANLLGNTSSKPEYLSLKDTKDDGNGGSGGLDGGAIAGIVIGVLVLLVIIIVVVYYCKSKERSGYKRGNANVKPGDNGSEDAAENTYDTASGPSGSRTKPSKGDAPVVYSAVDKENRQGRPLYATLDEAAMRAPNNRKTPEEERPEPTQYASIEFGKTEEVPKADLV